MAENSSIYIRQLLSRYANGDANGEALTETEASALAAWVFEQDGTAFNETADLTTGTKLVLQPISETARMKLEARLDALDREHALEPHSIMAPVHRLHLLRTGWRRFASAAAVLIVLAGIGSYVYFGGKGEVPVTAQTQEQRFHNPILPAKAGATLKLQNGTIINLDTAANGQLVAGIAKDGESLSVGGSNEAITYATLSTDKGTTRSLRLPDGSIVYLDAQSSVTFPNRFAGKTREINITGRVYIEAFHDSNHPLITHTKDKDVTVWGTQFNIDAYGPVTTTLVEGKVQVGAAILKPGEQYTNGKVSAVSDLDRVTAWKDNNFKFEFTPIREVTAELSRWYDMDIEFHDNVDDGYRFTITRNVPLSDILKAMEINGLVKFTIEGKKVTVYKANSNNH